jgi:hypothetical protein
MPMIRHDRGSGRRHAGRPARIARHFRLRLEPIKVLLEHENFVLRGAVRVTSAEKAKSERSLACGARFFGQ